MRWTLLALLVGACDATAAPDGGAHDGATDASADASDAGGCADDGDPCTLELLEGGCVHVPWDMDGDGFAPATGACGAASGLESGDCVDADPAIHPGAVESCNGRDDDCDLTIDEGFEVVVCAVDADGDGAPTDDEKLVLTEPCLEVCPPGFADVERAPDCDDGDPAVRPGVADCPE